MNGSSLSCLRSCPYTSILEHFVKCSMVMLRNSYNLFDWIFGTFLWLQTWEIMFYLYSGVMGVICPPSEGTTIISFLVEDRLGNLKFIITLHINWYLLLVYLWSIEPLQNVNPLWWCVLLCYSLDKWHYHLCNFKPK